MCHHITLQSLELVGFTLNILIELSFLPRIGIVHTHTGGTMPLFNTFASHKTYIDPHTYEDPHQAVRQFAKELV